jgi:hypothetical protein
VGLISKEFILCYLQQLQFLIKVAEDVSQEEASKAGIILAPLKWVDVCIKLTRGALQTIVVSLGCQQPVLVFY